MDARLNWSRDAKRGVCGNIVIGLRFLDGNHVWAISFLQERFLQVKLLPVETSSLSNKIRRCFFWDSAALAFSGGQRLSFTLASPSLFRTCYTEAFSNSEGISLVEAMC